MAKKQYDAEEALMQDEPGTAEMIKGKIPKRLRKQMEGYKTVLSKLMHSKEMRSQTMDMLKAGPPEVAVPQAALQINSNAERLMQQKGLRLTSEVKLAGATFLVGDLIELGNAGRIWENPVDEEESKMIFQDTLQDYIQTGLEDGSIDPIQLQQDTEPLLNDQQRQVGSQIAQQEGVPMEVNQNQMMASTGGVLRKQTNGGRR